MALLKQSTTYTRMFLLVQTADHLSGLTGATPTVNISKAGGAFAAAGGVVTEVANGFYKIALTTTDTNTVGDLAFHVTAASGDATDFVDQVTAAVDQTGDNFARLGAPAGASISADIAAAKVDTAAIKVQTDKLTFTVANQVDSNVLDWKSAVAPAMTGDAFARLGAPAGVSVSADVAAVKSDTGTVLTDVNTGAGAIYTRLGAPAGASISADIAAANATLASGVALTSGERNSVADALLNRDLSTGADGGSTTVRTVRQALRFLRNKWAIAAGTLTVYKEDDATASWTSAVATDAAALPIVSTDPAGP